MLPTMIPPPVYPARPRAAPTGPAYAGFVTRRFIALAADDHVPPYARGHTPRVRNHRSAAVTGGRNDTVALAGLDVRCTRAGMVFKHNAVVEKSGTRTRNVLVKDDSSDGFRRTPSR